jgi:hypothetical protein
MRALSVLLRESPRKNLRAVQLPLGQTKLYISRVSIKFDAFNDASGGGVHLLRPKDLCVLSPIVILDVP